MAVRKSLRVALAALLCLSMQPLPVSAAASPDGVPASVSSQSSAAWVPSGYLPNIAWGFSRPAGVACDAGGDVYVLDTLNDRVRKFSSAGALEATWGGHGSGPGQFETPGAITVDAAGDVYVADGGNDRIEKFSAGGSFISSIGGPGTGDGQLSGPSGVAVDGSGLIYVADTWNSRVQVFGSDGSFIRKWGSYGPHDQELNAPMGIAVDSGGYVYVVDSNNVRVSKWTTDGTFVTVIGMYVNGLGGYSSYFASPMGIAVDDAGWMYVTDQGKVERWDVGGASFTSIGTPGSSDGQLSGPKGVAVTPDGKLLVADTNNNRVERFTPDGTWEATWRKAGSAPGRLDDPSGVAADASGAVVVADTANSRLERWGADGSFLDSIGSSGTSPGQFDHPRGAALDATGDIYVADTANDRIQKLDPNGTWLATWGSRGSGDGQFVAPRAVTVDASGNVYVADTGNHRIQELGPDGGFVAQMGGYGSGDGQLSSPYAVSLDATGDIVVADTGNNRVQVFRPDGAPLRRWGTSGSGDGQFAGPAGVAVAPNGRVIVSDQGNQRLQEFTAAGTFVASIGAAGDLDGQFGAPAGIGVSASGVVFVADEGDMRVQRYRIDMQPPVTTASGVPAGWTKAGSVTMSLSATDAAGSGVTATYYRIGQGATQQYTAPVVFSSETSSAVSVWSVDAAGNTEAPTTVSVRIDRTPPQMSSDASSAWRPASPGLGIQTADGGSGVAATYYTIDGGPVRTYDATFTLPEGTSTVRYWAVDTVGNAETTRTVTLRADAHDPVTTSNIDGAWHAGAFFGVSLTATDTPSGVRYTYYDAGGGAMPYFGPFPVSAEGTTPVRFWSVDAAGNVETSHVANVLLDRTAPHTMPTLPTAWRTDTATVSFETTDALSGVTGSFYRVGSGATQTYGGPFTVSAEGTTPVSWWAVDAVGNVEATSTEAVRIDRTPPSTVSNIDADWHKAPFSVTLTPADAGSGVAATWYKVGGAATQAYAGPFTVSAEGTTTVSWWSADTLGHVETTKTAQVMIENGGPVTLATGVLPTWVSGLENITLTATDATSGVAATFYSLDGGSAVPYVTPFAVSKEGTTTLRFWSVDRAGNTEAANTATIRLDRTPPVTTATGGGSWTAQAATITLSAADALSGLDSSWYSVGEGPATAGSSVVVTADGPTDVHYWSFDKAGNQEPTRTLTALVDVAPPVSGTSADDAWHTAPYSLRIFANDLRSGVATTYYSTGGPALVSTGTVVLTADGPNLVRYWSVDRVGNSEPTKTATVLMDSTPPVTTHSSIPTWSAEPVTVLLAASDALSGVSATYYVIAGQRFVYAVPLSISSDGTTHVDYYSVDAAGNTEQAHSFDVRIDRVAPETSATADVGWRKGSAHVSLGATDALSGVAETWYRIGAGGPQRYSSPFVVTDEGATAVQFWSIDKVGNVESPRSVTVYVDNTPPTTFNNVNRYWQQIPFDLYLWWSDSMSGVVKTYYRVGSDPVHEYSPGSPVPVMALGRTPISIWSVDAVGNSEVTRTVTLLTDMDPPVTQVSGIPAGWTSADVSVALDATDTASGAAATYYWLDGVGRNRYSAPFTVSKEGTSVLEYWSTDESGNDEAPLTATVRIDRTPPVTASDATATYDGAAIIHLTPTDALSGVASTGWQLDTGPLHHGTVVSTSVLGTHTLSFESTDTAGNGESPRHLTFQVVGTSLGDVFPPSTAISTLPSGWSRSDVSFTLTFEDEDLGSGVAHTWYRLTPPSSVATYQSMPVTVSAEGTTTVAFWSEDASGNIETTKTAATAIRIDKVPPQTTTTVTAGAYPAPLEVRFTASDALSGVAATWVRVDDRPGQATSHVTLTSSGAHTLKYRSVDNAGNSETTHTLLVTVTGGGSRSTDVTRVAGAGRYATAALVSSRTFQPGETTTVIIATGENWPDALGGAALAGAYNAPILLTHKSVLPPETSAEIRRLQATHAIILGSESAVDPSVQTSVGEALELGGAVERFGGGTRYDTARRIASETVAARRARGLSWDRTVFVATGRTFPDALAASPFACRKGWPVLLVDTSNLLPADASLLNALEATHAVVLGGTGAVAPELEKALKKVGGVGGENLLQPLATERWAGATDRYTTGVFIADRATSLGIGWDGVAVARGETFPDALAAGAAQGHGAGSPLVLTPGGSSLLLNDGVKALLVTHRDEVYSAKVIGSESAISNGVFQELKGEVFWPAAIP